MLVSLESTVLRRLDRGGIARHAPLEVTPDVQPGDTWPVRSEAAAKRLEEAPREQGVAGHGAAVHGALVVQRGGDDLAAPLPAQRLERLGALLRVSPLDERPQRDPAVAGIE